MPNYPSGGDALVRRCSDVECDGGCCYGGTVLHNGEKEKILKAMHDHPDFFSFITVNPFDFAHAAGVRYDKIIAVQLVREDKITDFPDTMCIFRVDGGCSLQKLAEKNGLHKWTYKPKTCWMFPMYGHQVLSVIRNPKYPCCAPHKDAVSWREALAEEIMYFNEGE